jgi:hypothetical protein
MRGFNTYGIGQYEYFRLEIVEVVQDWDRRMPGQFEIELLLRGCSIALSTFHIETSKRISDSVRIVDLNASSPDMSALALDGFKLQHDGYSNSSSHLRFTLTGSDDNWTSSFPVASSEARLVAEGVRVLAAGSPAWASGAALHFDTRLSWSLILSAAVHPVLFALLCATASICGALNRPRTARRFAALFCSLIAAALLAAVLGAADPRAQNLSNGAAAAAFGVLGAVVLFDEYHFPAALALLGLLSLAARLVEHLPVFYLNMMLSIIYCIM